MKRKVVLCFCFLLLILNYSCKHNSSINTDNDYKQLVVKIRKAYKLRDIQKTKHYLKSYLKLAEKDNNLFFLGKAYHRCGIYYKKFNEKDSAYYFYYKALPFFTKIKDSLRLAKTYLNIAYIESDFQDYSRSNSTIVKALELLKRENRIYRSKAFNCLAINARGEKKYELAIDYCNKAFKNAEGRTDILAYKNNLANVYKDFKKFDSSVDVLNEILNDTIVNNDLRKKARVIDNLGFTKWLQDKNRNVLSDLLKAKSIRIQIKDFEGLVASFSHLSDYYNDIDKKESLKYAYEMYRFSKKSKSPYDVMEAIDKITFKEKPTKAIIYAHERIRISDSLQLAIEKSQDKYALIKYKSEEYEKKALQNKFEAEQQKNQKQLWTFIGLTSFLGFVSYVFYKRNKTKKEKIVEVYNTETRLAKKIHDVLANDMYLVMNKLQKEKRENTSILYDLEKIYTLTRNISRENSPVITGNLFEGFLKQLFVDFTTDTCKVMNKGLSEVDINVLQKEKQIVLYRLLQELLVNMKKHSQASLVIVAFSIIKDTLQVEYKDNGVGVDTIEMKSGLKNMETRIKSIGGTITFELETQKGFHVTFRFKK
ncbi:ATP-binding protein [Tenacibaculum aiptasiae]|uniref:tetratricopeptide repeat-containing sensor histidine kinase n=1 Tax=Tenacibaculum aiptasiae TaxID=426481 RepID=UPI003B5CAE53